ncbi:MAG: dual specificity protein phosphatase family protein [Chloroflexi bacterium]|nr:dual specificity protein phosphatase family protein [Chloroflexota bacterium]
MPDVIYWIEGPWQGRLAILTRPRGRDWLEDDVAVWQRAGLDLVVSLLTMDESAELGLEREGEIAHRQGLEYISFPIADRKVPTSREDAHKLIQQLTARLSEGKHIGVHCRQGVGRSALLAASVLVSSAVGVGPAFERIEKARGCPVPDTPEQRLWVEQFGKMTVREKEMPTEAGPMVKGAT